MITEKISNLFLNYLAAFETYDLAQTKKCYALPCLLSLPDTAITINTVAEFELEFDKIFTQLKDANTAKLLLKKQAILCSVKLYI